MPTIWQEDAEDTWTLRGDEGEVLAAVAKHGDTYRVTGEVEEDRRDYPTLEEAQQAVQRRQQFEYGGDEG